MQSLLIALFVYCLLRMLMKDKYLHVVVASDNIHLHIITAYYPNEDEWEPDFKTRKGCWIWIVLLAAVTIWLRLLLQLIHYLQCRRHCGRIIIVHQNNIIFPHFGYDFLLNMLYICRTPVQGVYRPKYGEHIQFRFMRLAKKRLRWRLTTGLILIIRSSYWTGWKNVV